MTIGQQLKLEIGDFMRRQARRPKQGSQFPAIIDQTKQGDFGFMRGAIPAELEGKRFKTAGDAVQAFIHSEAAHSGEIDRFQIQEDGHISRPYRKVTATNWVKDEV